MNPSFPVHFTFFRVVQAFGESLLRVVFNMNIPISNTY